MMAPLAWPFLLNQVATYWAIGTTPDGFGGFNFAAPVLISCRWQNNNQLFRSSTGEELTSSSVIWPDIELAEKGYLALGNHVAISDPKSVAGAGEIRGTGISPSVNANEQMMKAFI